MKLTIASIVLSACVLVCPGLASAQGKNETRTGKEVYTGTLINMRGGVCKHRLHANHRGAYQ